MPGDITLLVGAMGEGLWRSVDGGESWTCSRLGTVFPAEKTIFGLAASPSAPGLVFAGAPEGLYRSEDGGESFALVSSPVIDGVDRFYRPVRGSQMTGVWRVAVDPRDPDLVYAGTSPAELFRSRDGGKTWELLPARFVHEIQNGVVPRVVAITVDPRDSRVLWTAVEIDGVQRSLDGGATWKRMTGGVMGPHVDHDTPALGGNFGDPNDEGTAARDIHALVVSPTNPDRILVANRTALCLSEDRGETWRRLSLGGNLVTIAAAVREDDDRVLFTAPGTIMAPSGFIQRSRDGGESWERRALPVQPNALIVGFATHPGDPDLVFAYTRSGQVFRSTDGGDHWMKLAREFTRLSFGGVVWFSS